MATVFFEPSTRTRLSFEAACLKLGGDIISVENAVISSSDKKGESLEDAIKTISQYADVIVLRHPETGSAQRAAENSDVPVINAGDGDGEHPTQALLDLYTIWKEKGTIDGLNILFHADIEHARTVNSLKKLLGLYDVEIKEEGLFDSEVSPQWEEADVVYVTRIQSERYSLRMNDAITQINKDLMGKMKNDAILLHPLPRCGEVSRDVDSDHRSAFWRQVKNGMYVRMALLKMVLGHI
jgi:aspartate carbamoyltransferase catalytic subunit